MDCGCQVIHYILLGDSERERLQQSGGASITAVGQRHSTSRAKRTAEKQSVNRSTSAGNSSAAIMALLRYSAVGSALDVM